MLPLPPLPYPRQAWTRELQNRLAGRHQGKLLLPQKSASRQHSSSISSYDEAGFSAAAPAGVLPAPAAAAAELVPGSFVSFSSASMDSVDLEDAAEQLLR